MLMPSNYWQTFSTELFCVFECSVCSLDLFVEICILSMQTEFFFFNSVLKQNAISFNPMLKKNHKFDLILQTLKNAMLNNLLV